MLPSHGQSTLLVDSGEFVLAESAPDAEGFANRDGVLEALHANRAGGAHLFRAVLAGQASGSALTLGVEEHL